ncbi:MAG: hypothetical protein ACMUHB_06205, partial [Thermoplasmatota archaeon]
GSFYSYLVKPGSYKIIINSGINKPSDPITIEVESFHTASISILYEAEKSDCILIINASQSFPENMLIPYIDIYSNRLDEFVASIPIHTKNITIALPGEGDYDIWVRGGDEMGNYNDYQNKFIIIGDNYIDRRVDYIVYP